MPLPGALGVLVRSRRFLRFLPWTELKFETQVQAEL